VNKRVFTFKHETDINYTLKSYSIQHRTHCIFITDINLFLQFQDIIIFVVEITPNTQISVSYIVDIFSVMLMYVHGVSNLKRNHLIKSVLSNITCRMLKPW